MAKRNSSFKVVSVSSKRNGAASEHYTFRSLKSVASKTKMSVPRLRTLLREGQLRGDKISGIWITNIAAVQEYRARTRD